MKVKNRQQNNSNDILKSYFKQINREPLLEFEEEKELSIAIQNGDRDAKKKLIEFNLRLVVKIARGYINSGIGLLDLIQEGNIGLMKAAEKYDYRKNVRFSTYASWWIKQSIARAISNKKRAIRLPHRKEELLRKIQKVQSRLNQQNMKMPTTDQIAATLNIPVEQVESLLRCSYNVSSLDSEINDDNSTLHDVCEDTTYQPDKTVMDECIREETINFMDMLREREKKILLYRFNFYGGGKYTLKKIGEKLGLSPETVRQIEIRALNKLKDHADQMKEYVYG